MRRKIVKERGAEPDELEENVAQVCIAAWSSGMGVVGTLCTVPGVDRAGGLGPWWSGGRLRGGEPDMRIILTLWGVSLLGVLCQAWGIAMVGEEQGASGQ